MLCTGSFFSLDGGLSVLMFSCGDLFFINFINTFAINQATGQTDCNFIGKFFKGFFFLGNIICMEKK